jgi:anti-anti-sigma regulatory factor
LPAFFVPSIFLDTITVMLHNRVKILSFHGPFVTCRTKLQERFVQAYDDPLLIIDLSGVHLVDGAFLDELGKLRAHRRSHSLQIGRLVIDSPYVRSALTAIGFERNWPIFRTIEAAVTSFDGPPLYA